MRFNTLFSIFFLFFLFRVDAQVNSQNRYTIVEYEGEYFMPEAEGIVEKTMTIAPDISRMKPSQVNMLKRKLEQCSSLFSNDSLLQPFKGLKISLKGEILFPSGIPQPAHVIPAKFEAGIFTTLFHNSLPFWNSRADAAVTLHFNNPAILVGNPIINDIYLEPKEVSRFFRWPEFDRVSVPNRVVAFKNNNLEFFEPVSKEDFILTLITFFQVSVAKTEKKASSPSDAPSSASKDLKRMIDLQKFSRDLEEIRKYDPSLADKLLQAYLEARMSAGESETDKGDIVDNIIMLNSWREAVRKLKAEMNSMSSRERKSQAWWSNTEESNVSGLTPAGFSGSRPLVRLNKNLIDKTKPSSSIQLIVAEWSMLPGSAFEETIGYNLAFQKLYELGLNQKLWDQVCLLLDP